MTRTCDGCGAVYELVEEKLIMRDKDKLSCNFCGTEIISWNGAVMYTKKLVSGPPEKK